MDVCEMTREGERALRGCGLTVNPPLDFGAVHEGFSLLSSEAVSFDVCVPRNLCVDPAAG